MYIYTDLNSMYKLVLCMYLELANHATARVCSSVSRYANTARNSKSDTGHSVKSDGSCVKK